MIWTTDRTLLLPRRGNRRAGRPFARTFGMADGDVTLDSSGNRILDGSGNAYVNCCCATYVRAKKCSDGSYASYSVVKGSVSLPYYFLQGSDCYSVENGNTEASTPFGSVVSSATLSGCSDDACLWVQARFCEDGSDADLWFPPGTTLPIYFTKSGTSYYVNSACNRSATPGTHASGYTLTSNCPTSCCTDTVGAAPPGSVTLTISGLTRCTTVTGDPDADACLGAPSGNGTWVLPFKFYSDALKACFYEDYSSVLPNGKRNVRLRNNGNGTMTVSVTTFVSGCGNVFGGASGSSTLGTVTLSCTGSVSGTGSTSGFTTPCVSQQILGTPSITVSW